MRRDPRYRSQAFDFTLSGVTGVLANQTRRYRQIVDRVENLTRQPTGKPSRITDLCKIVGVSQRMLRSAFHQVHGIAPYRYIRRLRMNEARKALSSPWSPAVTVTHIATDCGFLELGRFSVEYRLAFGECPSATLRRALTARPTETMLSAYRRPGRYVPNRQEEYDRHGARA